MITRQSAPLQNGLTTLYQPPEEKTIQGKLSDLRLFNTTDTHSLNSSI